MPTTALTARSIADVSGLSSIPPSRHASRDETSRTSSFAFEPPFNSLRHQHVPKYHQISGFTSSASATTTQSGGLILTNGSGPNLQEQVNSFNSHFCFP